MSPGLGIPAGLAAGLVLGAVYFAGLWATVRGLPGSPRPGRRLLLSFGLRAALVVGGFLLLARAGAVALLAGMLGFLLARAAAVRRVARPERTVR